MIARGDSSVSENFQTGHPRVSVVGCVDCGQVGAECDSDLCVYVLQVVQLLKAGKGKEVSYNALATHIIAEDGDNPEVGESREVFDLPVVKVSIAARSMLFGQKHDDSNFFCVDQYCQSLPVLMITEA